MATSSGCSMQVGPRGIMAILVFVFCIDLRTSSVECALNESNTSRCFLVHPGRVPRTDDSSVYNYTYIFYVEIEQ